MKLLITASILFASLLDSFASGTSVFNSSFHCAVMSDNDYAVYKVASTWYSMASFKVMMAYLTLVLIVSPVWRRLVSPLNIGYIVVVYNALCSVLSAITMVLFFSPLIVGFEEDTMFSIGRCKSEWMALGFQLYYYTKILELLDTLWMVLRHKGRQITVLHVYHHGIMVVLGDVAYVTSLPAVSLGLGINSCVHVVMYMYYCVTALRSLNAKENNGTSTAKEDNNSASSSSFLSSPFMEWLLPCWRRRMTEMQLLQFFIGGIHNLYGYKYHRFCPYGFMFLFTLVVLFFNFYYQAYLRPRSSKKSESEKKSQ